MKRSIIIGVLISAICLSFPFLLLLGRSVLIANIDPTEQEIAGYAAALSTLPEYADRSREEMMEISEEFIIASALEASTYDFIIRQLFGSYSDVSTHHASGKDLPAVCLSISELKQYIADSIHFDQRQAELSEIEDDKKAYLDRAADKQEVLDQLNADPNPDLYDYCRLYYVADDCAMTPLFDFKKDDVVKIVARDGGNGNVWEIVDTGQRDQIIDLLNDFTYSDIQRIEPSDGWTYILEITVADREKPLTLTFKEPSAVEFGDAVYTASEEYFAPLFKLLSPM